MSGYMGRLLVVDLTSGQVADEPLDQEIARDFVGGSGYAARYLFDELEPGTDPLGPDNILMFVTGPLVGTRAPSCGRHEVCALSPLTGIWGESNAGGFWGTELKFAGYDGIIVRGRSEKPVWLSIIEGQPPALKDATALWGLDTYETQSRIHEELGDEKARVACIGPAGENMVLYAAVVNDHGRAAGRTGMGAVMGSKNLKAIAVRGTQKVPLADGSQFREATKKAREILAEDITLGKYGQKGILFLDEINRASREVQQAAFELVLDHRLNLRDLPKGWKVVTAINDNDDLYTVGSLDPAFVSRFMVIDFEPSQEEWLKWAREEKGIHESIIQFLTKHKEFIDPNTDTIDENNKEGVRKLYDRRSWERFSDTIFAFEEQEIPILSKDPENIPYMTQIAAGFMGNTASIKWKQFIESDYETLNAKTILHKWDKGIEDKIKAIVKAGRIPELAAYNDLIIQHLKKEQTYGKKGIENLTKYVALMPKEVTANFWQSFNLEDRAMSEKWYNAHPDHAKLILNALVKPDSMKDAAPTS